jgi:hypothetical protein
VPEETKATPKVEVLNRISQQPAMASLDEEWGGKMVQFPGFLHKHIN